MKSKLDNDQSLSSLQISSSSSRSSSTFRSGLQDKNDRVTSIITNTTTNNSTRSSSRRRSLKQHMIPSKMRSVNQERCSNDIATSVSSYLLLPDHWDERNRIDTQRDRLIQPERIPSIE